MNDNSNWTKKSRKKSETVSNSEKNIVGYEDGIVSAERNVKEEEQSNANTNYSVLKELIDKQKSLLPYPDVNRYDTGFDYDDIERIQIAKKANQKCWDEEDRINKYYGNGSLYCGHIKSKDYDMFLTEQGSLDSSSFSSNRKNFVLINVDDRKHEWIVRSWRFPEKENQLIFSRNITLKNKDVTNVDVVVDNENEQFKDIADSYLRDALIRNKNNDNIVSIIQTIQEKQNQIRSLPKNNSFIVQGCAGSGKTIVLLHRLRYLLFNNDINQDNFIFLVSSYKFKRYIKDISGQFHINMDNIQPYTEYYRICTGKKPQKDGEDFNELVFAPDYLLRVYSREFISECYREMFYNYTEQVNKLIEKCESILNDIVFRETSIVDEKINNIKSDVIYQFEIGLNHFRNENISKIESFNSLKNIILELNTIYNERKAEVETYNNRIDEDIEIAEDDARYLSDIQLQNIQKEIATEEELLKKASIFTSGSHKKKLAQLNERYTQRHNYVKSSLIKQDKEALEKLKAESEIKMGDLSVADAKSEIDFLTGVYETSITQLKDEESTKKNINDIIAKKYEKEITALNDLIEDSTILEKVASEYSEKLVPSYDFFAEHLNIGIKLYNLFLTYVDDKKEKEKFKSDFVFFSSNRTGKQLKAYLNANMFNACKKKIKNEFDINLCNIYKHYWYLTLYFHYLSYGDVSRKYSYIYTDETQDLCPSEIELIYKINSIDNSNKPIMNAFGDINQSISANSIHDWNKINFITNVYNLDENFRNPNQVTRFCNKVLPFKMKEIGVDLNEVSLYEDWDDFCIRYKGSLSESTFIVKDDYYRKDLEHLLEERDYIQYQINTVKEIKGFEFKEIFVVDSGMTDNEKYIAYTRALKKLHVISSIPVFADRNDSFIVQGEEMNESEGD